MKKSELIQIIKEELNKALKENSFNALDPLAPDWQDYEGYETTLELYFDEYGLEDSQEFMSEYSNGDLINNLALDIAKRSGFKGNIGDLINNEDLNNYCNWLATEFMLQYGKDMGLVNNMNFYKTEMAGINSALKTAGKKLGL